MAAQRPSTHTHPPSHASARQANITNTREKSGPADTRPPRKRIFGDGIHNSQEAAPFSIADALNTHLAAERKARETEERVTMALAKAVDDCIASFKHEEELPIACTLRSRIQEALINSALAPKKPAAQTAGYESHATTTDDDYEEPVW